MLNKLENLAPQNKNPEENNVSTKAYLRTIFKTMSLVSGVVTFLILLSSYLLDFGKVYILFTILFPILFLGMYLLDIFKKYQWSRFYGTTVLPIYINIITICTGGGISETPVMLAFLIFAFILYDKNPKLKYQIILFNLFCHIAVLTYVAFYPPLITDVVYPFDEVIIFSLAVGWIYVFLKKYEFEKNKFAQQLKDKNKILITTSEELERFTQVASYDLKSPLRTIISFVDLSGSHLRNKEYDKLKDDLKFIKSGAEGMNYLIQDILEFSQINGKVEVEKRRIDFDNILQQVESNLFEEIHESKAKITKNNLPEFYGNQTEFVLLFQNLIQNAIQYNESQPPIIKIWAEQSESSLSIFVQDNGNGIEEDFHEKIFQFFKRLNKSDQYQGTGLGLCKKIIEKQGGNISVESEVGKDSTFIIVFPI